LTGDHGQCGVALALGPCAGTLAATRRHLGQHGRRQNDLIGTIRPPQHLGQALGTLASAHNRADDFSTPVADGGAILAAPDFQPAGQNILLAVAHQRGEGAVFQTALVRTGLAQRSGFRIRQAAFDHIARPLQALQGGHRVVAAQAAREGIGHSARQQVNLAGNAVRRAGRHHLDANRQGRCLQHGHELAQGAAFPLGDAISRWSGHTSDLLPS
jgi:hypothetical protein